MWQDKEILLFKVPYGKKDLAKRLGLRWIKEKSLWYSKKPSPENIPKEWFLK